LSPRVRGARSRHHDSVLVSLHAARDLDAAGRDACAARKSSPPPRRPSSAGSKLPASRREARERSGSAATGCGSRYRDRKKRRFTQLDAHSVGMRCEFAPSGSPNDHLSFRNEPLG
jgi:hypothetical protein